MRLIHVSDLHFGHHDEALAAGFAAEIDTQSPDLLVISGDFTQIGSRAEFETARKFLDSLNVPYFAVPGNHDIPERNVLRRFVDPYGLYRRYIAADVEPDLEMEGVALAGLKTTRRMRLEFNWSHGSISRDQLVKLAGRFAAFSPEAVRVVVAHHPVLTPEKEVDLPHRAVDRADLALETFSRLGVRLVLSGHFHLAYVRHHEQPGTVKVGTPPGPRQAAAAPIIVAQASSAISTRLRGEPNAYNVVDISDGQIEIGVREWMGSTWRTREHTMMPAT